MGSGTSTAVTAVIRPANGSPRNGHNGFSKQIVTAKPLDIDPTNKIAILHTNLVAPIIIKNCNEEYQHVSDLVDPIVYGRLSDNAIEHPLLQGRYFLVNDNIGTNNYTHLTQIEDLQTVNVHQAAGGFPVFGMGQPTKDGLDGFIRKLKDTGKQDILLFNLRAEPVLFVRQKDLDMAPYSPRHADNVHEVLVTYSDTAQSVAEVEVAMRKEIMELASLKDDQKFYFYNSVDCLDNEPRLLRAAYEDDVAVTEEIYCRLTFYSNRVRYARLCWATDGAPTEKEFDAFINEFKNVPNLFSRHVGSGSSGDDTSIPAVVFTSHRGRHRATVAMVMAVIVLGHIRGFSHRAANNVNEKSSTVANGGGTWNDDDSDSAADYSRGNYFVIRRLVKQFPNGEEVKRQVDMAIDACSQTVNLRQEILDSKTLFDQYVDTGNNQMNLERLKCQRQLERYISLICFNAYLHSTFTTQFGEPFSRWMKRHPMLYRILKFMDVTERKAPIGQLLESGQRLLVADDYIGLDVLSSQFDVKTSNFRRVPGLPVYGMAQPSATGLACVINYLHNKKQAHSSVVVINLRDDLAVECDDMTYSIRDVAALDEPITLPAATSTDLEEMEEQLKNVFMFNSWKVCAELDSNPESKEFRTVRTCLDMCDVVRDRCEGRLVYRRLPMIDDAAPCEQVFDEILSTILSQRELCTDEDGPAFVFHCRTGKGRTTTAMAIAGLVICHVKGFPYGTKPGEEERVSLPNAKYTQGHYKVVQEVVRRIPDGHQVKREVDFILNQCSETMTPMHYHIREVIFVTYNKMKKAKTEEEKHEPRKRSLDLLERYIYLILFNTYLHCDRYNRWQRSFSVWMTEVATNAGIYDILDNLAFFDFETTEQFQMTTRRARWTTRTSRLPARGHFI